jgi:hypothetical protein
MPATSVYIASTTGAYAATSASAASRASKAHDAACAAMMDGFTSQGATMKARQTYAECVQRLNPPPPSDPAGDKFAVAVLLAAAVIGAVIGAVKLEQDLSLIGGAFFGALLGLFCAFLLGVTAAAVLFVAS